MNKKNLLLLVPNLQLGGQERIAVNTVEILSGDYDITFVVFDSRNIVYTPPCEIIDLAIPAARCKLAKISNALRRARALHKLKKEKRIEYTLSFGSTANLVNVLSGQIGKIIISVHGFGSISSSLINRVMYQRSDTIVCCAQKMCSAIKLIDPAFGDKSVCVYNPYDIERLMMQGNEPVTDYIFSSSTIIAHGRLDEVKNYPRLIKAFSLVRKQIPDAQLLIIGEGSQRTQLEETVKYYHLESSVTLLGFRKNPFAYLANSSLYVLSSYSEGFPNALIEGMTFLPAIAVDCKSGPREILSNGSINRVTRGWEDADYGILVQPAAKRVFYQDLTEDDRTLAEAILSVLTDSNKARLLQEKANARAGVFSYEAYRENLVKIITGEIER